MDAEKWLTDNDDWDYELMFRRGEIDLGDALDLMEEYAKYYYQSKVNNGVLDDVSQRTFTSTCIEVENMAVEIDQFINQHALAKPMTYSRKLRQYLANKLNEYVG